MVVEGLGFGAGVSVEGLELGACILDLDFRLGVCLRSSLLWLHGFTLRIPNSGSKVAKQVTTVGSPGGVRMRELRAFEFVASGLEVMSL